MRGIPKYCLTQRRQPVVMGILNCTPDSFYEASREQTERGIARRAECILREGGSIIDIGACSTRPGSVPVDEAEEMARIRQALSTVRRNHPSAILSIDTFRPAVARMAVEEYGADWINDVSEGGESEEMFREAARAHVPYILTSQQREVGEMLESFRGKVARLRGMGVEDIILDPGYGFGKDTPEENLHVLREQWRLREAFPDLPILAGLSRKRMVWQTMGGSPQDESTLQGTMLLNLVALQNGADILRVHDVRQAVNTIDIFKKTRKQA